MGTAIKHPVPDRVKPLFVIFDIWALWRPGLKEEAIYKLQYVLQVMEYRGDWYSPIVIETSGFGNFRNREDKCPSRASFEVS